MVCFMVISGIQMMSSRMIDIRRTFVIAVSLMFGLSADIFPQLYQHVHPYLKPFFSSSLTVTTVLAVGLNLIMRIGISRRENPGIDSRGGFFGKNIPIHGKSGRCFRGARKDVIYNVTAAMNEFMEAAVHYGLEGKKIIMTASFDELSLDIRIIYEGPAIEFPKERPDMAEIVVDNGALARMSGYLVRHYADKVRVSQEGNQSRVDLHFDH